MTSDAAVLSVRALNHWRDQDELTYVGLRTILETQADTIAGPDPFEHASARLNWTRPCRFRQYPATKGLDRAGEAEYRDCYASSPATALTESWVLQRLSQLRGFANHGSAYSYLWPAPGSGGARSYSYYYDGYARRNAFLRSVAAGVESMLVLDVRSFYPSVRKSQVMSSFAKAIDASKSDGLGGRERSVLLKFAEATLDGTANVGGIPVGPAIGHVMANEVLRDLDERMTLAFPGRYARYVDDIVVGGSGSEVARAERMVADILEGLSLKLNEGKRDVVSGPDWTARAPGARRQLFAPREPQESFDRLVFRVAHFASVQRAAVPGLRSKFADAGFRLPALAFGEEQRRSLLGVGRRWAEIGAHDPLLALRLATDTPAELLAAARRVRDRVNDRLRDGLRSFVAGGGPVGVSTTKWEVSLLRFLYVRWLHLASDTMLRSPDFPLPHRPEFGDLSAIHDALVAGSAVPILRFPGGPCRLLAELFSCTSLALRPLNWGEVRTTGVEVHAVLTLAGHGLLTPPSEWVAKVEDHGSRALLRRLSGYAPRRRQVPDLSAVDELDSLLMGDETVADSTSSILHSRVDESELAEGARLEVLLRS